MIPFSRRAALSGLTGLSVCALASRMGLAAAAGAARHSTTIDVRRGRSTRAFLSLPDRLPAPAVLTIHDSLGLSDWYRTRCEDLAKEGFVGLSVDLFAGRLARDLDGEEQLIDDAYRDPAATTKALVGWVDWLRRDPRTNAKVGIVGWSFGAWWALHTSIATPTDATVIYYGLKYGNAGAGEKETRELGRLKGPLLAHFGELDTSIPADRIDRFWGELKAAGTPAEIDLYPANHGFGNPWSDCYDRAAAVAAWKRTLDFLRSSLRSPSAEGALRVE